MNSPSMYVPEVDFRITKSSFRSLFVQSVHSYALDVTRESSTQQVTLFVCKKFGGVRPVGDDEEADSGNENRCNAY